QNAPGQLIQIRFSFIKAKPEQGSGSLATCSLQSIAGSDDLEQTGSTLATTNAHGHHHILDATALAFDQRMAGQARAGDTVGVADGDGATVHVQVFHRDAQTVTAVDNLGSEGFVQLPQTDIIHGQAVALEQTRNGEDRADAHFVRLAAGNRETAEDAHGLDVQLLGNLAVHDGTYGRAVGQLAGVAGGDEVLRATYRLQAGQCFQSGLRTVALVAGQGHFLAGDLAGFLVLYLHGGGEGYDLVVELAGFLASGNALLAEQRILVLGLAAVVVAGSHDVGVLDHGQGQFRLVLHDPLVGTAQHVDLVVLAQADQLDAAGNDGR